MTIKNFVEKINQPKHILVLLPLIVLLEIGRTFYPANSVYILSRVLLLYCLIFAYSEAKKNKQLKVYIILVILFALWALITTFWSYDPMVTFPRAFYFAYVAIAAAIGGYIWNTFFPKSFLGFLLHANILIIGLSFFSLVTNLPANAWTGGCGIGFMGFAPHQNTLGMMILLTIPSVLFPCFLLIKVKFQKTEVINSDFVQSSLLSSIFYLLLFLLNLYLLIFTQSRGSLISVLLIIVTFLIFTIDWKYLISVGLTLVLFIAALVFTSPQIKTSFIDYIFKTEQTIGDRRSNQISTTITAAKNGGLIGLGYGISDPQNINKKDLQGGTRYYREKMISVLALVEEVGVIGMSCFLAIVGYVFSMLLKTFKKPAPNSFRGQHSTFDIQYSTGKWQAAFMIGVLVGLCFDAQIEAWWLGAGSWQFFLFFSLIGSAIGVGSNLNRKV